MITDAIKRVVLDVLVSVCAANSVARACYIMTSFCKRMSWCHDVIIIYLLLILLILVNFKSLLWPQFLTDFWQTRMHFKAENLLFPTMYHLWGSMIIYLWITKNNDQICDSGLFCKMLWSNSLVSYRHHKMPVMTWLESNTFALMIWICVLITPGTYQMLKQ